MRAPATSGARVNHGQARKPAAKRPVGRKPAAKANSRKRVRRAAAEPEIKITRRSPRPQIKASRGPGATPGKAAAKSAARRPLDRAAATRRESLNSLNASYSRGRPVATGAGGAAAGALRVASEVARPAAAAARPMLRVISGGIDRLPSSAAAQPFARGRIMIMIAAVLGAGLIYINVGKLQAGDGYGKYAARAQQLQRENIALRAKVSYLSSPERIQTYATRFGMASPLPEQFTYLNPKRGDALKGANGYNAPTNTGASPTAALQQQASAPDPANQTAVGGTETNTGATAAGGAQ